jgi:single-strand DNA-binding protein
VTKGMKLYVEGRIYTRKWQDKDGTDRYTTEITADHITMLSSKNGDDDSEASSRKAAAKPVAKKATNEADDPFDDEIPF